jgi:hypothetical protein
MIVASTRHITLRWSGVKSRRLANSSIPGETVASSPIEAYAKPKLSLFDQLIGRAVKITVITDRAGTVLGTARHEDSPEAGIGRLIAGDGQVAHEITLTEAMEKADSAEALHSVVADHLAALKHD